MEGTTAIWQALSVSVLWDTLIIIIPLHGLLAIIVAAIILALTYAKEVQLTVQHVPVVLTAI